MKLRTRWSLLGRAIGLLPSVFLAILPRAARADERDWRFLYSAPAVGCPTRDQARALVVARLGFDPFLETGEVEHALQVDVSRAGPGYEVRIVRMDGEIERGQRTVHDASGNCDELVTAAALAGSILVDPTGALRPQQAARTAQAPSTAQTTADDPFKAETKPASPPAEKPRALAAFVGVRGVGSVGLLPAPSIGLSGDAGIGIQPFVLRLEVRGDLPASSERLANGSGGRASLYLGSLAPCYVRGMAQFCGVLSAGVLFAESTGTSPVERDTAFILLAGLRSGLEIPVWAGARITVDIQGTAPLRRATILARGQEIWTAPPIAGSLATGMLLHFL